MGSGRLLRRCVVMAALGLGWSACFDEPSAVDLSPPEVFADGFAQNEFQAFAGSKLDALGTDATEKFAGGVALKVSVPSPSDPSGGYAGGAFVATRARDLSGYNALTFYAKASTMAAIAVVGLGNDNTGNSRFTVTWKQVPLTTTWTRYVIPIPLPAKLTSEKGLFYFSAASAGAPFTLWIDEVRFDAVPAALLGPPRPSIKTEMVRRDVGDSFTASDVKIAYAVEGANQTIEGALGYFTWTSSNPAVVTVGEDGKLKAAGPGTATVTAKLGTVAATGTLTVQVGVAVLPQSAAPTPTQRQADVISLFSDTFTNVALDTFRADWSSAGPVTDVAVAGNAMKKYAALNFAGIEFTTKLIDASAMAFFHVDVWTPDATVFKLKLVDFGANGAFGGGDDREHELTFNAASTPALIQSGWVSLDLPLASFSGLTSRAHVAQVILSASENTVFVDNIYFHK